jgi:transcription elongation factor Elf1
MMRKRRKVKRRRAADEGAYVCPSCGEKIVIPVDVSAGGEQRYVEDCPVCCNANVIHVELMEQGEPARVWAEGE